MGRRLIALGVMVVVVCAPTVGPARPAAAAKKSDKPTGVYVSTSGIPHADVGDYRQSPHWRPGMPTGISVAWRRAIHTVIRRIAAEEPDAVFHTGDMVEGRWGIDREGAGVFGPVRTRAQRRRAISRAATCTTRR